jgi:hypothetical protein
LAQSITRSSTLREVFAWTTQSDDVPPDILKALAMTPNPTVTTFRGAIEDDLSMSALTAILRHNSTLTELKLMVGKPQYTKPNPETVLTAIRDHNRSLLKLVIPRDLFDRNHYSDWENAVRRNGNLIYFAFTGAIFVDATCNAVGLMSLYASTLLLLGFHLCLPDVAR